MVLNCMIDTFRFFPKLNIIQHKDSVKIGGPFLRNYPALDFVFFNV